ncbi:phosphatase PAP2 family protein [Secundilactobacillus kimchicus]|uniref:phosphatase PAP2 family protein n=1 Tax=Secundilactobacillus kimchicus TaxID=528209 RepID=UPI0024A9F84F|nr:phosphatase PAP2 family protein [Secundilactobacillus kimchicus]
MKKMIGNIAKCTLSLVLSGVGVATTSRPVQAQTVTPKELHHLLAPKRASYGYYIETYQSNTDKDVTPAHNAATALFNNSFATYWDPTGTGQPLNAKLLKENQQKSVTISQKETPAEFLRSYLSDRRDSPYNEIPALGPFAPVFIKLADAQTHFTALPAEPWPATAKDDPSSRVVWANKTSTLRPMVQLVNLAAENTYSSSGHPKKYFKYVRPFRQGPGIHMNKYLVNVFNASPKTDYDFPSGHTTQAFETALMMAYALPQRFQQEVTRASEVGLDRILVGRHSPLAVMGGRVLGTAVAAAVLNDPNNAQMIQRAYQNAQTNLANKSNQSARDDYKNYQTNLKHYDERMTYGFKKTGSAHVRMTVPKGAEALLKTRFPYLTPIQRREVLYTTGFESGYPVNDDTEGWGRLNLVKAAGGFGRLLTNTTVNMTAKNNPYGQHDTWQNNIGGQGRLIKTGSGALTLAGHNSFNGLTLNSGQLIAANSAALGDQNVTVARGHLRLAAPRVVVKGHYTQRRSASLSLTTRQRLTIRGRADLGGTLKVTLTHRLPRAVTLIRFNHRNGKFRHVQLVGSHRQWRLKYTATSVQLVR